MTLFSTVVH